MNTTQLSVYDNAKRWIAQYEAVDDVKDFIDKTAAVQEYAKRAQDFELEHKAAVARLRAERKCGELLSSMEKAKGSQGQLKKKVPLGGRVDRPPKEQESKTQTLKEMGLSKNQSSNYQRLAKVPEEKFEEILDVPGITPSTSYVLKSFEGPAVDKAQEVIEQMDVNALDVWGELEDIQKKYLKHDLTELYHKMTEPMQEDMQKSVPKIKAWLETYNVN